MRKDSEQLEQEVHRTIEVVKTPRAHGWNAPHPPRNPAQSGCGFILVSFYCLLPVLENSGVPLKAVPRMAFGPQTSCQVRFVVNLCVMFFFSSFESLVPNDHRIGSVKHKQLTHSNARSPHPTCSISFSFLPVQKGQKKRPLDVTLASLITLFFR